MNSPLRRLRLDAQNLMFGPSTYGDSCADFYDEIYGPPNPWVVRALMKLADGGSCLELGLGTGRTALTLMERGLTVTGIESSTLMHTVFRAKPGAERVRAILDDFGQTKLNERFNLIFALVNTFSLIDSLRGQRQCFQNLAEMLEEDGVLVIESVEVPSAAKGTLTTLHQEVLTAEGMRPYDVRLLLQPFQVLDQLAAESGLGVRERWRNWFAAPHREGDPSTITIYERRHG